MSVIVFASRLMSTTGRRLPAVAYSRYVVPPPVLNTLLNKQCCESWNMLVVSRPLHFLKRSHARLAALAVPPLTDPGSVISLTLWLALQEPSVPATCFPFHFPCGGMEKVLIAVWHLNSLKGYYNTGGGAEISRISLIGLLCGGKQYDAGAQKCSS